MQELGADDARVQCIDCNSRTGKPLGELTGEQDVGKLGGRVCRVAIITVCEGEILDVKSSALMSNRADIEDAARSRCTHQRQQAACQQERSKMIDGHRSLE